MWHYHPDLLAAPVPRYTSFPTAAEFGPSVGAGEFEAALARTSGDVSLYVHIPFCEEICWYCGCNTGRSNRHARLASYLDALHREIALVGTLLPPSAKVRRLAFGGGSPNAIAPTDFVRLMLSLTHAFALSNPVISIELDPRSLDEAWGTALAGVGVTQASLGVQTTDAGIQAAIGRIQPLHLVEACCDLLRKAGVTSLNFDLMYGLPGQTAAALEDTLREAVRMGADRMALFGYAHVPHMLARQRRIDASALPDQQTRFRMAEQGYSHLVAAGYLPVGFDHFALPGDPLAKAVQDGRLHRNFQGFTDDAAPVLVGLGASAISAFPEIIVQNEKNAGRYQMLLSQDRLTSIRGIDRSRVDQSRARIIEDLLCHGRAEIDETLLGETASRLAPFIEKGLVERQSSGLVLREEARPYARSVAALFDPYRADPIQRFSTAI
ncbi:oxygen-independent coproporphyrinogen III oxidase [Novosphingobium sp. G106]|uniref:oxygen-independent coproporphyrinogen III oxidase n=1 Tax=Novosphingobium sp. G106 TaxID=2849500 RepID=UPI001C2DB7C4|nr:oxygen-independent coproporphyrinogen III oxidase [Novosphingobium sp. G106]MBV1691942.1 oxygen-independent coproporphyrinogen III oxidase [Novosphingobium sp. G106]